MAHTYASLAEFNDWLRDTGSTTFASESALIAARKLATLEGVSRTIDDFCERSLFGSGFGPRIGTNRYDGDGRDVLFLNDDLLSLTSLTTQGSLGATETTHTAEDDFVLSPYDSLPKRSIIGRGSASSVHFPYGTRTIAALGKWGYQDVRRTATATASAIGTTTTTSVTVSAATEFSPGQTILIDDEQMYIVSIAALILTVERGANGTTAATHGATEPIDIYEYPARIVACQLDLSLTRWKRRDAGSDASDGGGIMPNVRPRGDELSILRSHLGSLCAVTFPQPARRPVASWRT